MNKYKGPKYHHGRYLSNRIMLHKSIISVLNGLYTVAQAVRKNHVSRATLYRYLKQYKKCHLTRKENLYLMHRYTISLIHNGGQLFTGLHTTLADTRTILQGGDVPVGTSARDVKTIFCLQKGLSYIMSIKKPLSVNIIKHINGLVAYDALYPGQFATQRMLIGGIKYKPPMPSLKVARRLIMKYKRSPMSTAMKAIHLMLQYDRHQFFWDGNKRTAWLMANYYLLRHGGGILDINRHQNAKWNKLLQTFYETGNIDIISQWLLKNCIVNKI